MALLDSNLTFKTCWQTDEVKGVLADGSEKNRLIVVNAGSEDGFATGAQLMYKAGSVIGDYHGQMNSNNFEKQVQYKLIPNLPKKVSGRFDNEPYHCTLVDKSSSKYTVQAHAFMASET
jgi:hypothetical protein